VFKTAVLFCSEAVDYPRTLHCQQAHILSFHDSHITELHFIAVHGGYDEPGGSVGIATDYGPDGPGSNACGDEIFRTYLDRPWGPPSVMQNRYWVFPRGKVWPGHAGDRSPPSSAAVMEE